ncbi:MAG: hypothetical protein ACI9J3_000382 [Parvicellaceae bacterium]|jgi:hypothetical protein
MRKRLALLFGFMGLVTVFITCSTEFELNIPQETPVLYGILDQTADTQWIKLNKSFLGDGNNFEYAAINDCTEYSNALISVEEIGGLSRSWMLSETYVPVASGSGLFYTDSQKVYYFVPSGGLDATASYKITASFDDEKPDLEATTKLIGPEFKFNALFNILLYSGVQFESGTSITSTSYQNLSVEWRTGDEGRRYDLTMRLHYTEYDMAGTPSEKYLDYYQGEVTTTETTGNILQTRTINGESFFQFIGTHPDLADVSDVAKRVTEHIEFIVTAAADELNTYINVNQPVSGIVTERPTYTNVSNGIGIFSARSTISLVRPGPDTLRFKTNSMEELSLGQYTNGLLFCSDSLAYTTESFYCP